MIRPKVGLLAFSESLLREDVYRKRKPIADREVERLVAAIQADVEIVWPTLREVRSKRQAIRAADELEAQGVDAMILYVPIFVAPAVVAHTANYLTVPVALTCNEAADSLSQLAFLAVGGAIDQIGARCRRIPGDAGEEPYRTSLLCFLRAAAVKQQLRGQTYGCIGGRALGISTGTADLALWERLFGVDIDHVDQFEIVRRGEALSAELVQRHVDWLTRHAGEVAFNDSNFTPAHLDRQIRSYLATREIARQMEFDFIGVKCQPEMSNGYCLQCVNVALCNDPYDADGPKPSLPCSCEADADGALTMQILRLLSGGKPTSLNDITWMTDRQMTLANCGAMATYFTRFSDQPEQNLDGLHLVPHSFGEAGGAATQFTVSAGRTMTFARLFRSGDTYTLGVLTGQTMHKDRADQSATIQTRPLIFVEMHIDKLRFLESFGSNHILAVEGALKPELAAFAELMGIRYIDYDLGDAA
jgi:L-fucose isomerase